MTRPLHSYARIARLLRLAGFLAMLVAGLAVALAMAGEADRAAGVLQFAVRLGGAALLTAAALFVQSRRAHRLQDRS